MVCLSFLCSAAFAADPDRKAQQERFFENQVRPLLVDHCYECHSSDQKQEAGLRLDSRAAILQGGDNGPAAVARKPDESLIMEAVQYEGLEMPPDQPLEDEQIDVFRRWIAMGLPWPEEEAPTQPALGDQNAIRRLANKHWAFQPIATPEVPRSSDAHAAANPVDAFINARLAEQNLDPSPVADRQTLIRRMTFDVIGLPPTMEQVEDFVNDQSAEAVDKVIDRLLDSPHYGERWGRYWLDVARYADTQDWQAQTDVRYPFAYTFRDYVIQSLNADKPYDQFIREQLAADMLPDDNGGESLAALGFLSVGPRFRNNRLELAADQIDVITRGLMGLTVACARCHDHKYDPIPIEDYYSLYGVMASCEFPDELPEIAGANVPEEMRASFEKSLANANQQMEDYRDKLRRDAITFVTKDCVPYFRGFFEMEVTKSNQIRGVISKLKINETAMTPLATDLARLTQRKGSQNHPIWGPWSQTLQLGEPQFKQQSESLLQTWTNSESKLHPMVRDALRKAQPKTRIDVVLAYAALYQSVLNQWREAKDNDPKCNELSDADAEAIRLALLGDDGLFQFKTDALLSTHRVCWGRTQKIGDLEKAIGEVYASHPGLRRKR
ncbi:MAG: DUF1549 domain-containing protein [Pirellulaceae bacterium]